MFALGVKAEFVVLTFAGCSTRWGAIAADVGASLLVVANALRLPRSAGLPTGRGENQVPGIDPAVISKVTHGH